MNTDWHVQIRALHVEIGALHYIVDCNKAPEWLCANLGPSVSGGRGEADLSVICQCIETAKYRHKELTEILRQQLEAS